MIALQRAAASVLVLVALSAAGAKGPLPHAANSFPLASDALTRSTPFLQLGARSALQLRGDGGSATLDFGSRGDELVTRAVFHFRYAWSPALAPAISHIRLTLNGDAVGTLPLAETTAGMVAERSVEVDPRLLVGFNKLAMTLVAARGEGAADPARPGLWAEVGTASELEVVLQPLTPADDLAILPEPFFDRHDQRRVTVPFVFGAQPSTATLRAAAVVASWFGQLARWRGARFPVTFDAPSATHCVAFVANNERPAFLAALPAATGPQIRLMTNPADNRSKLLLLLGRDGEDLKAAADALVIGGLAMSGPAVQVKRVEDKGPLAPYDAPAWVPLDRAVKLGELIDWAQQLEASGRASELEPIRVDLRVPPDLATWRGPGVPLTLKLQYTPAACVTDGSLDVSVNDELLQTLPLRIANESVLDTKELFIPYYRLRSRSELAFGFRFAVKAEGQCADRRAALMKAIVLPESTLDFSGFPHYARMPNLAHFAALGFPFTRRADLSDTVVVLPDKPAAADIEVMLALIARMGEATGHPATRVRVTTPKYGAAFDGADLLVIGASPQQTLLDKWAAGLPIALSGSVRRVSRSAARMDGVFDWAEFGAPLDPTVANEVTFEGTGPLAALYAFQSPVTSGRSVVAVTGIVPEQLARVIDALDDRDMRRAMKGSAAFVLGDKVQSVLVGPTYYVGFLPPWTGTGYWLSQHPEVLGVALTIVLIAMGYGAFLVKSKVTAWRARGRRP